MRVALAAALLTAGLAVYLLRLDTVAGLIGDDAWYVVLAKGIATGAGPRVISSAGVPFLSQVYPPGFPALLSLLLVVKPALADTLTALKAVPIAAMLGSGLLAYRVASRHRALPTSLAVAVAVITVMTPALVFLATSTLMSEAVFLLVELTTVLAVERAARMADARANQGPAAAAGALAAAAFLIRSAGLTVGLAALVYFAWTRRWRTAAAFGATAALCVAPWVLYARAHAPARADLVDHGGLMSIAYADQFWTAEAGTITARHVGPAALPARVERNVVNIAIRDMGGIFVPIVFRTPGESGLEVIGLGPPEGGAVPSMGSARGTQAISLALSALALIGFAAALRQRVTMAEPLVVLALAMIVLWPFWTFRFVLPLVPFLLIYLVLGVETVTAACARIVRHAPPATGSAARTFVLVLIGLNVLDHAQYIAQAYGAPRGASWKAHADDIEHVFDWIRTQTPPAAVIAADNPALVYLRTGRHTIAIDSVGDRWDRWRRMHVRYVVSISDGAPIVDRRAILRFKLPDQNIWAYELTGLDGPAL